MITGPITLESLLDKPLPVCYPPKDPYKDSYEALYEKESDNEKQDVKVIDRNKSDGTELRFIWNRGKSNSNVTDTGKGKFGYSFYYARYVYYDKYIMEVPELATDKRNTAFLGRIFTNKRSLNDFEIPVMLVVQTKNSDDLFTRIVSSYFKDDDIFSRRYFNRALMLSNKNIHDSDFIETEDVDEKRLWDAWQEYKRRSLAWEEANKLS